MKYLIIALLLVSFKVCGQEDCVFDQASQTDEFIKDIKEFSNYTWNDSTKTATILLNSGDTLFASRGGCNHFALSGTLIQQNQSQFEFNQKRVFEKALWIAERLFDHHDFGELNDLIEHRNYSLIESDDNGFFLQFNHDDFSEYYLLAIWSEKSIRIEIGYYYS